MCVSMYASSAARDEFTLLDAIRTARLLGVTLEEFIAQAAHEHAR